MATFRSRLILFLLAIPPTLALPPKEYETELFYSNWTTFPSGWEYDTGTSYPGGPTNWGTGEIQTYTSSTANIAVNCHGNLVITPVKDISGNWTSARIRTRSEHDVSCPVGGKLWVEGKVKLGTNSKNQSMGIWPAFWLLGSPFRDNYWNWPEIGELDILESVNGFTKAWHVVHCSDCDEMNGLGDSGYMTRGRWHTLAVEVDATNTTDWRRQFVRFFVDGRERHRVNGSSIGTRKSWIPIMENSKMILLDVAVGGAFPDGVGGARTPNNNTIGGHGANMEIEYVAAYSSSYDDTCAAV